MSPFTQILSAVSCLGAAALLNGPLFLGPEEIVATTTGIEIAVPGFSVPSLADWDNDGRLDLVVGEGGFGIPGKVRVYPNVGSTVYPRFDGHFFAQAAGSDLALPSSG